MPRKHVTNRQGRDHVEYAGLLDYSHRELCLSSIVAQFLQAPAEADKWTAITWAKVVVEHSTFTDIGDANPDNIGRVISQQIVCMSETRRHKRCAMPRKRDSDSASGVRHRQPDLCSSGDGAFVGQRDQLTRERIEITLAEPGYAAQDGAATPARHRGKTLLNVQPAGTPHTH
jgi:hypothetical protein